MVTATARCVVAGVRQRDRGHSVRRDEGGRRPVRGRRGAPRQLRLAARHNRRMLTKVANTPRYLVVMALSIVITSSGAYAIAEHQGIGDAVYWALITATTVGYGDTYPKTPEGRVVAILLVFSMVL